MAASSHPFAAVRNLLETAIAEGTVPGAVILCASEGATRFHAAFGLRQTQPGPLAATTHTLYDIASVTKAVSTSVLAMKAVAAGLLTLDDQVSRHIPEFQGDGKSAVTVRQLLCHASGLPAHRPFYERQAGLAAAVPAVATAEGRTEDQPGYHPIVLAAAAEPLIHRPGTLSLYSDLGFILLGALLERATGEGLDVLFARGIAEPLGLSSTAFVNLRRPHRHHQFIQRYEVAPTQMSEARGRLVLGEVDDLNAFAMGGVAGHAGLFSDAADLGALAGALVNAWHDGGGVAVPAIAGQAHAASSPFHRLRGGGDGDALVPGEVIREFWRPAGIDGSTWRLGWDGPAERDSQAGTRLSRQAVGHLGFTGCSLWIDPRAALWVVLLTNRVHPVVRQDPRFRALRAAVHDAAVEALGS